MNDPVNLLTDKPTGVVLLYGADSSSRPWLHLKKDHIFSSSYNPISKLFTDPRLRKFPELKNLLLISEKVIIILK